MKEWQEAKDAAEETLEAYPNQPEARRLLREIMSQQQLHLRQQRELHRRMMRLALQTEEPKEPQQKTTQPSLREQERELRSCADSDWIFEIKWAPEDNDRPLWSQPHSLQSLEEECNFALTRSLPLTALYALSQVDKQRTQDTLQRKASSEPALPNLKRKVLCIHLLGASARRDLSCRYTALLQRWPEVETLMLVFVGFNHAGKAESKFERTPLHRKLTLGFLKPEKGLS